MRKKKGLRYTALACASLLFCGGVAGIMTGVQSIAAEEADDGAMGRYLEEEVALPEESVSVEDTCFLEDGTFRILYRDAEGTMKIADSTDKGATWGEPVQVGSEVGASYAMLAKDGSVNLQTFEEGDSGEPDDYTIGYYMCSPEGEIRELELGSQLGETPYVIRRCFGDNGNLFLMGTGVYQIDTATGEVLRTYEEGEYTNGFGLVGNHLIVMLDESVHYYDVETGEPAEDEAALTEQIMSREENRFLMNTETYSVVFAQEDGDNLFYADRGGMYHYSFGGSVVEQIIDGSLNSIGSPGTAFKDLERDEDGALYLAVNDSSSGGEMEGKLLKYVYSKEVSAVPDTELKVYSLEDNSYLQQAAVLFQKEHPDVYVNIQTGMSGDDAITTSDALKTLNTEIMAGNGPDVLLLDGIPEEVYVERGMLEDISGIIKDAGLLENILQAYEEEDGSIYCMPTKFGIPLLAGNAEDLDQINDLTELADAAEAHQGEYNMNLMPTGYNTFPGLLLRGLATTSAPAWIREDGTLDQEKVRQFFSDVNRIYQAGQEGQQELYQLYQEYGADLSEMEGEYDRTKLDDFLVAGSSLMTGQVLFEAGAAYSANGFGNLTSAVKAKPEISYKLFNGQAENCFFPQDIVGISAKANEKEAAEQFVAFLFGETAQASGDGYGFAVRQDVYEGDETWHWENAGECTGGSSWTNNEDGTTVYLDVYWPDVESMEELRELGKTLTVPAVTNEIILSAVTDAGKRYLNGETDLDSAVSEAVSEVNLYLAE